MMRKNLMMWVVIAVIVMIAVDAFYTDDITGKSRNNIPYSEFLDKVNSDSVASVKFRGDEISGTFTDGSTFTTLAVRDNDLVPTLRAHKVEIDAVAIDDKPTFGLSFSRGSLCFCLSACGFSSCGKWAVAVKPWALAGRALA